MRIDLSVWMSHLTFFICLFVVSEITDQILANPFNKVVFLIKIIRIIIVFILLLFLAEIQLHLPKIL